VKKRFRVISNGTTSKDTTGVTPGSYIVVKGDYLKKIAKTLLGNESLWKSIYEANKDVIKNPDVIYPGMTLVVPTTN
jgi:nucleoid-associated protein YgaU